MPQKCKTAHGAFTYNQPHTPLGINKEGANFVLLLQTSSPHGCSCWGQPALPTTGQQPCSSSWRGFSWEALGIAGPWLLSIPSIYSTIAAHRGSFQLFKTKTEYLKGSDCSFSSNKWVRLHKYSSTDSSFHRISWTHPTTTHFRYQDPKLGKKNIFSKMRLTNWLWKYFGCFNQISLHKSPQWNSSNWYQPTHWLKT